MKPDLFAAWGFSKSPKFFCCIKKILSFYESVNIIVKSITIKASKAFIESSSAIFLIVIYFTWCYSYIVN